MQHKLRKYFYTVLTLCYLKGINTAETESMIIMTMSKFIILLFISLFPLSIKGIHNNLKFRHLSIKNGLLNNSINSIKSDHEGFIWIATNNGLHKFDGYSFTIYTNINNDTSSIRDNYVIEIIEDNEKNIWVATNKGIDLFDRTNQKFHHIPIVNENLENGEKVFNQQDSYYVNFMYKTPYNDLYIGTRGSALYKVDKKNKYIKPFLPQLRLNENLVKSADEKGNIFIATAQGAYKVNEFSGDVKKIILPIDNNNGNNYDTFHVLYDSNDNLWISCNKGLFKINKDEKIESFQKEITSYVRHIYEDNNKSIWFSTLDGLYCYEPNHSVITKLKASYEESSLSSNRIKCVYVDENNIIWVGTEKNGIDYASLNSSSLFQTFKFYNKSFYENNPITDIFIDGENVWLASDGAGIAVYDINFTSKKQYYKNLFNSPEIKTSSILSIFKDNQNTLWFGGFYSNLISMSPEGSFKTYDISHFFPAYLKNLSKEIKMICQGIGNNILVATNGAGILSYNNEKEAGEIFINETNNGNSLSSNFITSILNDQNGTFWVGTYFGLNKWETKNNTFKKYYHIKNDSTSIPGNVINCLYKDKNNKLWIGTENGICFLNSNINGFTIYGEREGLLNSDITNILEDNNGNIWVSSLQGISKLDTIEEKFTNYTYNDGISGNEFITNSCFKDHKGTLFFGGAEGLTYFNPEDITNAINDLHVYIVDFLIFNKSIFHIDNFQIENSLNELKCIKLSHNQSHITFKYVAINYINPYRIKYQYKLEGFDNNWHNVGNERTATYSNLNPGKYIFKVKASNSNGSWYNSKNNLEVIIKPPIWGTIWAYIIYTSVFFIIVFFVFKEFKIRNNLKNQLKLEKIKLEHEEKLHQYKQRFFLNISHDLRTHLSLILTPVEYLLSTRSLKGEVKNTLIKVFNNASRLFSLINDLMDFAKIQDSEVNIKKQQIDLIKFCNDIYYYFFDEAKKRQIDYTFNYKPDVLICWFDPDKIERVLVNLLSNAFKFTPDKGKINVEVEIGKDDLGEDVVFIEIADNGCGISEENIPKIFERFFQVKDGENRHKTGTGIGLSIVKNYIDLHQGKIKVSSIKQKNTSFIIQLPIANMNNDEKTLTSEFDVIPSNKIILKQKKDKKNNNKEEQKTYTMLIVEDNFDLQEFLKSIFEKQYNILLADNGETALKCIIENMPDIILSDIVMPKTDGIELCKKIKNEISISHIPIILLTAKAEIDNMIDGIEEGADAYITKPFNVHYLESQVRNLIKNRKLLYKRFSLNVDLLPKEISNNKLDQKFLQKITDYIEENIGNEKLSPNEIADHVFLSHSQTYRKIKALTGQNINEFIRTIRMKKALKLLLNGENNITEITYKIGISSPAYFTKCFKEQFGKTPSNFLSSRKR